MNPAPDNYRADPGSTDTDVKEAYRKPEPNYFMKYENVHQDEKALLYIL